MHCQGKKKTTKKHAFKKQDVGTKTSIKISLQLPPTFRGAEKSLIGMTGSHFLHLQSIIKLAFLAWLHFREFRADSEDLKMFIPYD